MAAVASVNPKCLEQTAESIFYELPSKVIIDEDAKTRYSTSNKIEILIKELQNGPMVGLGKFGPSAYSDAPFKLQDKVHGQDVHGWRPQAKRIQNSDNVSFIILGAKKIQEKGYIYFTLSEDHTLEQTSYTRIHKPMDSIIYVVSNDTFRQHLYDLYPLTELVESNEEKAERPVKITENYFIKKLEALPLNSILDLGDVEKRCCAIGQEIFDYYKKQANGSSVAGKEAMQRICELLRGNPSSGKLRSEYVERAWDNIGDNNCRWQS